MTDDLVKRLRTIDIEWDRRLTEWCAEAADRIEELEAKLSNNVCPLGNECDLTVAYMAGAEKAKDTIRQQQERVEELEKQVKKDALQYLSDTGKLLDDVVEAEKASDEWAEIAMGMGKKFNEANARVKELEAEIKKLKQEIDA